MLHHEKLRLAVFNDAMFAQNGYLAWCDGTQSGWIIDPGFPPEPRDMLQTIARHGLVPAAIVLTHAHVDHIAGVASMREAFPNVPIWCPRGEAEMLVNPAFNLSMMMGTPITTPPADRMLDAGEALELSDSKWQTLDVRGHSPGGLAFYCEQFKVALVGDALMADSIGRYDFPHGNRRLLLDNIQKNLLTLPDETTIYSGHGSPATIGAIKKHNEVLRSELRR